MYKHKKVKKYRGSKTHGGGSMKKRRGAGHRGGRGRAGSGKKADQKKPSYWKEPRKKGFISIKQKKTTMNTINLSDIMQKIGDKKANAYDLNLKELGFDKLLGTGKVNVKLNVIVNEASANAIAKVEKAGGKVTLLKEKIEKVQVKVPKEQVTEKETTE